MPSPTSSLCFCYGNSHSLSVPRWCYPATTCYQHKNTIYFDQSDWSGWSVFTCDFHMGSSSGALVICSSHIRLWSGFYQLIRWYLTYQFDQTVHRVCAASAVKSTAPRWVSVFPLVSIALPHSQLHSNIHRHMYSLCVIIAKTAALLSLNSSVQQETKVYHLCFKWYNCFSIWVNIFYFPSEFASWSWVCTHSHLNAQQGCLKRTPPVLNKNCELFDILIVATFS